MQLKTHLLFCIVMCTAQTKLHFFRTGGNACTHEDLCSHLTRVCPVSNLMMLICKAMAAMDKKTRSVETVTHPPHFLIENSYS